MCCYRLNCYCFPDLFIYFVLPRANALYPAQHSYFSIIHQHPILFFHCPAFSPICHSRSYRFYVLSLTGTFLSQMTPVTSLHLFQASRTRFLRSVVVPPSASNIDPIYLNAFTFLISSAPSLTLSLQEGGGRYSVLFLLARSLLFSIAFLHNSSCYSASSHVFSHNTRSSANSIAWGGPLPTSFDITSITVMNNNGLSAEPWCTPTFTSKLSVDPISVLTDVVHPSYISCVTLMYYSPTFLFLSAHHTRALLRLVRTMNVLCH